MLKYIAQRLVFSVFVIWGVVTLVFLIMRVVPGDAASMILGSSGTQEERLVLRAALGLDRPIWEQYLRFLADAARGDLGDSFYLRRPALPIIIQRLPATLELSAAAMVTALLIAFPLGVLSALRANSRLDRVVSAVTLMLQSAPNYWIGLMLILVFARTLTILPTYGRGTWKHLIMPAITLTLFIMPMIARLVRSGMLDVMSQDYVRTARAKGLTEKNVVLQHVMRNVLIPVVTIIGLQFGSLLGGAVIVETVFAWPGVGNAVIDAISTRDYPMVQAAVLIIALMFVLINLVTDLLYGYLDPRISYS